MTVTVYGPRFDRPENWPTPTSPPEGPQEFEMLRRFTAPQLRKMGLAYWEKEVTAPLMLFPAEWYHAIPAGFEIEDINGRREKFQPGETNDDRRFGALPYGIRAKAGPSAEA